MSKRFSFFLVVLLLLAVLACQGIGGKPARVVKVYHYQCNNEEDFVGYVVESNNSGWVDGSNSVSIKAMGPNDEILYEETQSFKVAKNSSIIGVTSVKHGGTRVNNIEIEVLEPINVQDSSKATKDYKWDVDLIASEEEFLNRRLVFSLTNTGDYGLQEITIVALLLDGNDDIVDIMAAEADSLGYGESREVDVSSSGVGFLCNGFQQQTQATKVVFWALTSTLDGEAITITNWANPTQLSD